MHPMPGTESCETLDPAVARLLEHRYGDGLVYLRDQGDRVLYRQAVELGLISREGYLTPEGRAWLARFRGREG